MKATGKLLVVALAAAGMWAVSAEGADRGGRGGGAIASHGGGHSGRHWGGHVGGHWGGHRHWGGGWGYRSHWWGPRLGFYFGVPVAIGLGYWGSPYYWGYPAETVVYREVVREPEVVETVREAPADSGAPRAEPAPPASGPLYMNYCESAREYYPKVTRCPEGWKFITPTS